MEARDRPNSPAQIFAWRKEVRARLIADRLSIDPANRRHYADKIALHLSRFIEPLSKRTVSFYWPFRGEPSAFNANRCGSWWALRASRRCREKSSTCLSPLEAWPKARSGHLEYSDSRRWRRCVARHCGRAGSGFRQRWLSAWIWGWLLRSYTSNLAQSPPHHRRRILRSCCQHDLSAAA
jgi:hypothetical protein